MIAAKMVFVRLLRQQSTNWGKLPRGQQSTFFFWGGGHAALPAPSPVATCLF